LTDALLTRTADNPHNNAMQRTRGQAKRRRASKVASR
jgi:hypothetical protein